MSSPLLCHGRSVQLNDMQPRAAAPVTANSTMQSQLQPQCELQWQSGAVHVFVHQLHAEEEPN